MSPDLRLLRLDALHALAARLAAGNVDDLFPECLDVLLDATPARAAVAFAAGGAFDPVERRLASRPGVDTERLRRAFAAFAEWAATSRKTLRISDVRRELERVPEAGEIVAFGSKALLVQPLIQRRAVVATVVLVFDDAAMMDEETLRFVATVGCAGAVAIEQERGAREHKAELLAPASRTDVGLFATTLSHELHGPTNALMLQHDELVRLSAQLEMLGAPLDSTREDAYAELSELASEIGVAVTRLKRTVDQLSNMGKREGSETRVDVAAIAREAVHLARPHLARQGVQASERYDTECITFGRAHNLLQVVLNLVWNAAEACRESSGPHIAVRVVRDGSRVVLVVEDNGPGVPAESVEAIFQPFYSKKKRGLGAGLGLKIASDVVAEHGGHVEVHDRAGQPGAAFHVILPRVTHDGIPAFGETPKPPSVRPRSRYEVFVVDDDPVFTRALRRGLKPHDVRTAASASEAEIMLLDPKYLPDLVVCDVFLPGANGNVLHERILGTRPELAERFVFVTGAGLGRTEADYIKGSGRPTLLKPIDVSSLLSLLKPEERPPSAPASVRTLGEQTASELPTLIPPRL
jgi:signal transduction histidine kinase/ActR/RegA family two-component response regulator